MGQAKRRGTYQERVKQAQSKLPNYDILLRMYRKYNDPEQLCGTMRVKVSGASARTAISEGRLLAKHQLSQALASIIRKHDLRGADIIKDSELAELVGPMLIAYLSRFNSWMLVKNGGNVLVDYNHESIRGPDQFNFTLRGNIGSSEEYDRFESDRVRFWPTIEEMNWLKINYAPSSEAMKEEADA